MSNKHKYLFDFLYLYLLIILISGFIIFIPMFIFIDDYNHVHDNDYLNILQIGYKSKINLPIVICLTVLLSISILLTSYFYNKTLKYRLNNKFKPFIYKLILINTIIPLVSILFMLVGFFCVWLYPFESSNLKSAAYHKIITYSCLGSIICFVFLLLSLLINLYTKYKIQYYCLSGE